MAFVNGNSLSAADFNQQSYTPTLSNVTLGTGGTSTGTYQRTSDWVSGEAIVVLGTGGSVTGTLGIAIPVARAGNATAGTVGWVMLRDSSPSTFRSWAAYVGAGLSTGATFLGPAGEIAAAAVPWTWAAGDTIRFTFSYLAA